MTRRTLTTTHVDPGGDLRLDMVADNFSVSGSEQDWFDRIVESGTQSEFKMFGSGTATRLPVWNFDPGFAAKSASEILGNRIRSGESTGTTPAASPALHLLSLLAS